MPAMHEKSLFVALLAAAASVTCRAPALDDASAGPQRLPIVPTRLELPAPAGGPFPLGAHFTSDGATLTFRVRSTRATRIEAWLYAMATGEPEKLVIPLTPEPDGAFEAAVPQATLAAAGLEGAVYYGYRAWGPNWPYDTSWAPGSSAGFVADVDGAGNRFDPNKLLFDPYAREATHDPLTADHSSGSVYETGAHRADDSASVAPKAVVFAETQDDLGIRPARPFADDVVYEVHVRGLTMSDPTVPPELRGTYAGAATKAAYLRDLGVTAVEFLPVHESQNDLNDAAAARGTTAGMDYWGYASLAFFAPDRRYAHDRSPGGPTREFRAMVKAMHDAGIKVFLDVVYNHTAEGGTSRGDPTVGKLFSLRGLDNAAYYELSTDHRLPVDNTGVGENINAESELVRDLVLDSLHYWHDAMGADGFRFDLAPVLANACGEGCFRFDPSDPNGILARAATALDGVPLIAEPWVAGGEAQPNHQGGFPTGWSEWNGSFRDRVRRAQNELGTGKVNAADILDALAGSPRLFAASGRGPVASVNYVDCHDGFTLRDVYAYDTKNNAQPWPFGPSNGGSDGNDSWDQAGRAAAQTDAARTGLFLLLVGAGVPMFQGGDEMLRTLGGNNNPYDLDSVANWLDWSRLASQADFVAFARSALRLRSDHAALRPRAYREGKDHNGDGRKDITVVGLDGQEVAAPSGTFVAFALDGDEAGDAARGLYVAYNQGAAPVTATLPVGDARAAWTEALASGGVSLAGRALSLPPRTAAVLVDANAAGRSARQ
jgi:glycogen operon protein